MRSGHVIIGILLFSSFGQAMAAPTDLATVSVLNIVERELFEPLAYPAQVVSRVEASVLSENEGVVAEIYARLGQAVTRGQKVLKISHTDPVYNYAPLLIRAPVSGVVSVILVTEGSRVTKGEKIAVVTDPQKLSIKIEVAAGDLPLLHPGLEGTFKISQFQNSSAAQSQPQLVKIRGISPLLDAATGTASAELDLIDSEDSSLMGSAALPPSPPLRPGRVGQVEFKADLRKGLMVPEHAIIYRQEKPNLRIVADGKVKFLPVTLGKKIRDQVEILTGLESGAEIIERASKFITEGDSVKIQKDKSS